MKPLNNATVIDSASDDYVGDLVHWERKRTIEDDMHPGSDHPQCQHIKVGLVMF